MRFFLSSVSRVPIYILIHICVCIHVTIIINEMGYLRVEGHGRGLAEGI